MIGVNIDLDHRTGSEILTLHGASAFHAYTLANDPFTGWCNPTQSAPVLHLSANSNGPHRNRDQFSGQVFAIKAC